MYAVTLSVLLLLGSLRHSRDVMHCTLLKMCMTIVLQYNLCKSSSLELRVKTRKSFSLQIEGEILANKMEWLPHPFSTFLMIVCGLHSAISFLCSPVSSSSTVALGL